MDRQANWVFIYLCVSFNRLCALSISDCVHTHTLLSPLLSLSPSLLFSLSLSHIVLDDRSFILYFFLLLVLLLSTLLLCTLFPDTLVHDSSLLYFALHLLGTLWLRIRRRARSEKHGGGSEALAANLVVQVVLCHFFETRWSTVILLLCGLAEQQQQREQQQ
jgi:hypothetical protein